MKALNEDSSREFGDFQTPLELARSVCARLKADGASPASILEPTCGKGAFLLAAIDIFGEQLPIRGVEIQSEYDAELASIAAQFKNVTVFRDDIFTAEIAGERIGLRPNVLVLGNPPWVTNSELSAIGSANLPQKTNLRKMRGIDATTGASNFDIAEAMIYRLVSHLRELNPTFALLCKTQVARNVLLENHRRLKDLSQIRVYRINAKRWFGAAVDACFLSFQVGKGQEDSAAVYNSLDDSDPCEHWTVKNHRLHKSGLQFAAVLHVEGDSQIEWRQGVKHDASAVMELSNDGDRLVNGFGESVEVEDAYVFPILKSSDLANGRRKPRKAVLLTQRHPGDDTLALRVFAPRMWSYLERYRDVFEARGSSIYRNKSPFSIFGIGPYSFSLFKIAISGLYHSLRFEVVGPYRGKPVMFDDTCYFAACDSEAHAIALHVLLASEDVTSFLRSTTFSGAKRPITKKLLQRIDLVAVRNARNHAYWAECVEAALASCESLSLPHAEEIMREINMLHDVEQKLFLRYDADMVGGIGIEPMAPTMSR
jgi:hypothetical protein